MRPIQLKKTTKTPAVNFNSKTGVLEITGNSIPENSFELYQPLIDWVGEYVKKPKASTQVRIALDYFNTTSSKCIYELLKKFELANGNVHVSWHYSSDDEDIYMAGEEYKSLLRLDFELVAEDPPD